MPPSRLHFIRRQPSSATQPPRPASDNRRRLFPLSPVPSPLRQSAKQSPETPVVAISPTIRNRQRQPRQDECMAAKRSEQPFFHPVGCYQAESGDEDEAKGWRSMKRWRLLAISTRLLRPSTSPCRVAPRRLSSLFYCIEQKLRMIVSNLTTIYHPQ